MRRPYGYAGAILMIAAPAMAQDYAVFTGDESSLSKDTDRKSLGETPCLANTKAGRSRAEPGTRRERRSPVDSNCVRR